MSTENPKKRYHFLIANEFSVVIDVDHAIADPALDRCFGHTPPDIANAMLDKLGSAHRVVLARLAQKLVRYGSFDGCYCVDPSIPAPWKHEQHGIFVVFFDHIDVTALDLSLISEGDAPMPKADLLPVPRFLSTKDAAKQMIEQTAIQLRAHSYLSEIDGLKDSITTEHTHGNDRP